MINVLDIKSKTVKSDSLPPWKQDAEWVAQNGEAYTLMFAFTSIRNKKVIMDLVYQAEAFLRKKYPEEHSRFIDSLDIARKHTKEEITKKQEKAARRPADIIRFPAIT